MFFFYEKEARNTYLNGSFPFFLKKGNKKSLATVLTFRKTNGSFAKFQKLVHMRSLRQFEISRSLCQSFLAKILKGSEIEKIKKMGDKK